MFSSKSKTERTAAQAWEYLAAAMTAAGETARDTSDKAVKIAGKAGDLAGRAGDYAGRAGDLAGRAGDFAGRASDFAGRASNFAGRAGRASDFADRASNFADRASDEGHKFVGKAEGRADAAWARANAAAAALAGRKPSRPWVLIAGVGLLGVAVGYAVASSTQAARKHQAEQEERELTETAAVVTPTHGS